jgi:hypothetical protein
LNRKTGGPNPKAGLETVMKRKISVAAKNKFQFSGHSPDSFTAILTELNGSPHLMVTMTKLTAHI